MTRRVLQRLTASALLAFLLVLQLTIPADGVAYVLNVVVADLRQPSSASGGTACAQPMRQNVSRPGGIRRQWSTSLGTSPVTIVTADQTATGRVNEIENTIAQAYGAWIGVAATTLTAGTVAPLERAVAQAACAADGINSICFDQSDPAFTTGVLAFTRQVTADAIGERAAAGRRPPSWEKFWMPTSCCGPPIRQRGLQRPPRSQTTPQHTISLRCLRTNWDTSLGSAILESGAR